MTYGPLEGTPSQIEWAEIIRVQVDAEFDRVAKAFRGVNSDTSAIIAILEEKRREVLSRSSAGYFIQTWQELTDQVRMLIFNDARYAAIKAERRAQRT